MHAAQPPACRGGRRRGAPAALAALPDARCDKGVAVRIYARCRRGADLAVSQERVCRVQALGCLRHAAAVVVAARGQRGGRWRRQLVAQAPWPSGQRAAGWGWPAPRSRSFRSSGRLQSSWGAAVLCRRPFPCVPSLLALLPGSSSAPSSASSRPHRSRQRPAPPGSQRHGASAVRQLCCCPEHHAAAAAAGAPRSAAGRPARGDRGCHQLPRRQGDPGGPDMAQRCLLPLILTGRRLKGSAPCKRHALQRRVVLRCARRLLLSHNSNSARAAGCPAASTPSFKRRCLLAPAAGAVLLAAGSRPGAHPPSPPPGRPGVGLLPAAAINNSPAHAPSPPTLPRWSPRPPPSPARS